MRLGDPSQYGDRIGAAGSVAKIPQNLKTFLDCCAGATHVTLRLRHAYATRAAREEQLPDLLADASGPLRVSAATLLTLRGSTAWAPKAALAEVVKAWGLPSGGETLAKLSAVREGAALAPGEGGALLLTLIAIAERMREELAR